MRLFCVAVVNETNNICCVKITFSFLIVKNQMLGRSLRAKKKVINYMKHSIGLRRTLNGRTLYEASRQVVLNQTSVLQKYLYTFLLVFRLVFDLLISRPLAHSRLNICRERNSSNKMQKRYYFRTHSSSYI